MPKILFLKARDRGDTSTGDLFGMHMETRTRKDGVVQGYRVSDLAPNRFKGVDPVKATPDMFTAPSAAPVPAPDDAALLEGFPAGSRFIEGRGVLGRGKWAVAGPDGRMIGNLMATKRDAAQEARGFLRSRELAAAADKEKDEKYARIAEKLRAGKDVSEADLKALGLKPGRARFDYLSPVVQRLFGISRAKVREAMGDALSQSYSDMGTPSWWANPRKALANAAAYASGGTPALAKAVFLRRP